MDGIVGGLAGVFSQVAVETKLSPVLAGCAGVLEIVEHIKIELSGHPAHDAELELP